MTTLLAHIEIKPGREAQFEDIMKDMVQKTLSEEDGVLRYEYFKGQQDNFYYCLLAFRDKWAFYAHQNSPYHEGHDFGAVLQSIRLEYLDPVKVRARYQKRWTRPSIATRQLTWSKRAKSILSASQAGGVKGCNLTQAGDLGVSTGTLFLTTLRMGQPS